MKLNKRNF